MMIELLSDRLRVRFPEIHPEASCTIDFQRTLRVPDDNQEYPLPAGLGQFPILPVDDYPVPPAWKKHGGVFLPMYQSEALWINFDAVNDYPFAIKIAAGKINAVTGEPWSNALSRDEQDYVVIPAQPWLDGFHVAKDVVRQFVAIPLGAGVTAEEQLTGEAQWGGMQLIIYPMKAEEYEKRIQAVMVVTHCESMMVESPGTWSRTSMGLAPGGRIRQEISEDPYGIDVWDTTASSRCFVHLMNSQMYSEVTGYPPPTRPMSPGEYKAHHVPWFDHYAEGNTLPGSSKLASLDGLASALGKKGKTLADNKPIEIAKTVVLNQGKNVVREGEF
jgi:hypothetical protein